MAPKVSQGTKERIAKLLLDGKNVTEVRRLLAADGIRVGEYSVARQADRLGIVLRRGPRPGEGGRPLKGDENRKRRSVCMEPYVWKLVEAQRQAGESLSGAMQRLLLGLLGAHQTVNAVQ